jgi:hypothetical protein
MVGQERQLCDVRVHGFSQPEEVDLPRRIGKDFSQGDDPDAATRPPLQ